MDTPFFCSMLALCAESKMLAMGKEIHQIIEEQKMCNRSKQDELILVSSLVNMYAKCACLKDAQAVSLNLNFDFYFYFLFFMFYLKFI